MYYLVLILFFSCILLLFVLSCFFFNDTATTEIYTLSLHDALPICEARTGARLDGDDAELLPLAGERKKDRKSTRLNSSHGYISYAVFCLKKKKKKKNKTTTKKQNTNNKKNSS